MSVSVDLEEFISGKSNIQLSPKEHSIVSNAAFVTQRLNKILGIKKTVYPRIEVDEEFIGKAGATPEWIAFNPLYNIDVYSIAEETSHFLRFKLRPESWGKRTVNRESVHEFFGFLGRRLFYEYLTPEEKHKLGLSAPELTLKSRKEFLDLTREFRELRKEFLKRGSASIYSRIKELSEARKEYLLHYKGYYYASKVDLPKVQNLQALFSMSDLEIRRRFFRPGPHQLTPPSKTRAFFRKLLERVSKLKPRKTLR